jgi:hypothetical protein
LHRHRQSMVGRSKKELRVLNENEKPARRRHVLDQDVIPWIHHWVLKCDWASSQNDRSVNNISRRSHLIRLRIESIFNNTSRTILWNLNHSQNGRYLDCEQLWSTAGSTDRAKILWWIHGITYSSETSRFRGG